MSLTPEDVIDALGLEPHPLVGGFFRETYRSVGRMPGQERSMSTAIYYLVTPGSRSGLHCLTSDEIFHFYLGDPVEQLHLFPDGSAEVVTIGSDLLNGQWPQVLAPAGVWRATRLLDGGRFALLGTTMTPGFAYPDCVAGDPAALAAQYPDMAETIERFIVSRRPEVCIR